MAGRRSKASADDRHDAVIVGAGAIGLSCAWRAAQRGLRVAVVERAAPGAGASGVAAGMLAPVGETSWGEDALLRMSLAAHERWPAFAAELAELTGRDPGYLPHGALHVGLDRDEAAELRRRFELMRTLDLSAEWLRGGECRALEPGLSPSAVAGVHAAHEAGVVPAALVEALRAACERAGVVLRDGTEPQSALSDGDRIAGVALADGSRLAAEFVVLAAGAWSGAAEWLPPPARPPVRPVKGQILTLRGSTAEPPVGRIVVGERVYLVPRADGRLIVGATVEELGFDTTITAGGVHELLREAYRTVPEIAELELERAAAGSRPGTPDNLPLVGAGATPGLILATGHFRNGILHAPLTGDAVADLLTGVAPPPAVGAADPARLRSEPEPAGVTAP